MQFHYVPEPGWPALAWLARCCPQDSRIEVRHGGGVNTRHDWFCEACWDSDYDQGAFDRTDIVFGSGGRLRGESLTLVSSGSTCDRLQFIRLKDAFYVSNSLVCLAAVLDLQFDPWYPYYYEDMASINRGIEDYQAELQCDRGAIHLVYYRNLQWNGMALTEIDKPAGATEFKRFKQYRDYLLDVLIAMQKNMNTEARHRPYEFISTCSTGYDSLAVSTLARDTGVTEAICVPQDRLDLSDSGVELISELGMRARSIDRFAWRETDFAELPFIAGDACGRDAWLQPAAEMLHGRVLLTGNYGDAAWSEHYRRARGVLERSRSTGPAGLSLTEFRLHCGFVHCPLPYVGARALVNSPVHGSQEMQPWRLGNYYDRPIPRRIIEAAGIARHRFGMRKTATAVHLFRRVEFDRFFAGTESLRDFMRWVRQQSRDNPPPASETYLLRTPALETIEIPMFRQLFPWALERCKAAYSSGLESGQSNTGKEAL